MIAVSLSDSMTVFSTLTRNVCHSLTPAPYVYNFGEVEAIRFQAVELVGGERHAVLFHSNTTASPSKPARDDDDGRRCRSGTGEEEDDE